MLALDGVSLSRLPSSSLSNDKQPSLLATHEASLSDPQPQYPSTSYPLYQDTRFTRAFRSLDCPRRPMFHSSNTVQTEAAISSDKSEPMRVVQPEITLEHNLRLQDKQEQLLSSFPSPTPSFSHLCFKEDQDIDSLDHLRKEPHRAHSSTSHPINPLYDDSLEKTCTTHSPIRKEQDKKLPVWERLYREASLREQKKQEKKNRDLLEEKISSKHFRQAWNPQDWQNKWKRMMEHYRTVKDERDRLHLHMEFQHYLEEKRECTFQPQRCLLSPTNHPAYNDFIRTLENLRDQQNLCKEELEKCQQREIELDTQIKIQLMDALRILHNLNADVPQPLQRHYIESSTEHLVKEGQNAYTALMEQRLNLLHECTALHNAHYQWCHIHGLSHYDTSAKGTFDTQLVERLQKSNWFQLGIKNYPSMKASCAMTTAFHNVFETNHKSQDHQISTTLRNLQQKKQDSADPVNEKSLHPKGEAIHLSPSDDQDLQKMSYHSNASQPTHRQQNVSGNVVRSLPAQIGETSCGASNPNEKHVILNHGSLRHNSSFTFSRKQDATRKESPQNNVVLTVTHPKFINTPTPHDDSCVAPAHAPYTSEESYSQYHSKHYLNSLSKQADQCFLDHEQSSKKPVAPGKFFDIFLSRFMGKK